MQTEKIKEEFSFKSNARNEILACLDEKYGSYKTTPKDENVEYYYLFPDKSSIKVYKGDKGTILFDGRKEDYQEFREKDMRLNRELVEEEKANSPCISDLNFKHKTIGSDEAGKGEVFKNMVVTAAVVDGKSEIKKFIEKGVDNSEWIKGKISSIGEEITGIHSWEEIMDKKLLSTERFVTRIVTNEEYNARCSEAAKNGKSVHGFQETLLTEAYVEVLREAYRKNSDGMIVVDNFLNNREKEVMFFKEMVSFGKPAINQNHVFMTTQGDSKIMAVSLASVISSYISGLGYHYAQKRLNDTYGAPDLELPAGSVSAEELAEFFSKLKPERRDEFINKYAKKYFKNVKKAMTLLK